MLSIWKHRYSYGICFGPAYALQNSTPNIFTPNIISFFFCPHPKGWKSAYSMSSIMNIYICVCVCVYINVYVRLQVHLHEHVHADRHVHVHTSRHVHVKKWKTLLGPMHPSRNCNNFQIWNKHRFPLPTKRLPIHIPVYLMSVFAFHVELLVCNTSFLCHPSVHCGSYYCGCRWWWRNQGKWNVDVSKNMVCPNGGLTNSTWDRAVSKIPTIKGQEFRGRSSHCCDGSILTVLMGWCFLKLGGASNQCWDGSMLEVPFLRERSSIWKLMLFSPG